MKKILLLVSLMFVQWAFSQTGKNTYEIIKETGMLLEKTDFDFQVKRKGAWFLIPKPSLRKNDKVDHIISFQMSYDASQSHDMFYLQ